MNYRGNFIPLLACTALLVLAHATPASAGSHPPVDLQWFKRSSESGTTNFQWQFDRRYQNAIAYMVSAQIQDSNILACIEPGEPRTCSAIPKRCPKPTSESTTSTASATRISMTNTFLSKFSSYGYCGQGAAELAAAETFGSQPESLLNSEVYRENLAPILSPGAGGTPPPKVHLQDTYAVLPRALRRQAMASIRQLLPTVLSQSCTGWKDNTRVEKVRDVVRPAFYYDCAYQRRLVSQASATSASSDSSDGGKLFIRRDRGLSTPRWTAPTSVIVDNRDEDRRFNCTETRRIYFTAPHCTGDALVYIPYPTASTTTDPGPAFYRVQRNASSVDQANYETPLLPTSAADRNTWLQYLQNNLSTTFTHVSGASPTEAELQERMEKLSAWAHFTEILDRKVYFADPRFPFRRTLKFLYLTASQIAAQEYPVLNGVEQEGPFLVSFHKGSNSAAGSIKSFILPEGDAAASTTFPAGTCRNVDSTVSATLPEADVVGTQRLGRYYFVAQASGHASEYSGFLVRQYRNLENPNIRKTNEITDYRVVERLFGMTDNQKSRLKLLQFPMARPIPRPQSLAIPALSDDVYEFSSIAPARCMAFSDTSTCGGGGDVDAWVWTVYNSSQADPYASPVSFTPPLDLDERRRLIQQRSLEGDQMLIPRTAGLTLSYKVGLETNPGTPPTTFYSLTDSTSVCTQFWRNNCFRFSTQRALPTWVTATLPRVQFNPADCTPESGTCRVRIQCNVPPGDTSGADCSKIWVKITLRASLHPRETSRASIAKIVEKWTSDDWGDPSGLFPAIRCGENEMLTALGRNKINFGHMRPDQASAPLNALSPDERSDSVCFRYLGSNQPRLDTNDDGTITPVLGDAGNPLSELSFLGLGARAGSMACSSDAVAVTAPSSISYLFSAEGLPAPFTKSIAGPPRSLAEQLNIKPVGSRVIDFDSATRANMLEGLGLGNPLARIGAERRTDVVMPVNYGRCVLFKAPDDHPSYPMGPLQGPMRNYIREVLLLNLDSLAGFGKKGPAECHLENGGANRPDWKRLNYDLY